MELCSFFNCLPDELYRQDADLMEKAKIYIAVRQEKQRLERARQQNKKGKSGSK